MIKSLLSLIAVSAVSFFASSQSILFVDDNDYITQNSDTMLATLAVTPFSNFDYYNIADSASGPDAELLSGYDLVIWYASTDGAGLEFWSGSQGGNVALMDYLTNNGKLWVIGSDLLYAQYPTVPHSFSSLTFPKAFMGLTSYDVQSYGNDGNAGVPKLEAFGSNNPFPAELNWQFPTAWWVDGVTPQNGVKVLYKMGPASYTLAGKISMIHHENSVTDVMSSFFDPALIDTKANRALFMAAGINYMLNYDLGVDEADKYGLKLYPNPSTGNFKVSIDTPVNEKYVVTDATGKSVVSGEINSATINISLNNLQAGVYFFTIPTLGISKSVILQ